MNDLSECGIGFVAACKRFGCCLIRVGGEAHEHLFKQFLHSEKARAPFVGAGRFADLPVQFGPKIVAVENTYYKSLKGSHVFTLNPFQN